MDGVSTDQSLTPHDLVNQLRLLRIILTRFSQAAGLMSTQPAVQYSPVTGTLSVTAGYIMGGGSQSPLSANMVNVLADYLSRSLRQKVSLSLVRVQNPYSDANLLARYLSTLMGGPAQSSHTFKAVVLRLAQHLAFAVGPGAGKGRNAPIALRGVRVRVSGRLTTEPTRPRQTTQEFTLGTFRSNRLQAGSYTVFNSKGAMTIKVWLGL